MGYVKSNNVNSTDEKVFGFKAKASNTNSRIGFYPSDLSS
jgi:hypothetical protein